MMTEPTTKQGALSRSVTRNLSNCLTALLGRILHVFSPLLHAFLSFVPAVAVP
jgi:hypothetical protein